MTKTAWIIVAVILAAAGGAVWYVTRNKKGAKAINKVAQRVQQKSAGGGAGASAGTINQAFGSGGGFSFTKNSQTQKIKSKPTAEPDIVISKPMKPTVKPDLPMEFASANDKKVFKKTRVRNLPDEEEEFGTSRYPFQNVIRKN